MSNKSSNLIRSKTSKQLQSIKSGMSNPRYSGVIAAQRAIQQSRSPGSGSTRNSSVSIRGRARPSTIRIENNNPPLIYHPWELQYSRLILREKRVKSMTKDPYTQRNHLISHAVECIICETECSLPLISSKAVKIQTHNVNQAPTLPRPPIIRYVRRNQLLPSEREARLAAVPMNIPILPDSQYKKSAISVTDLTKLRSISPTLTTTDRLLNRAKMTTDPSVIRRPPRKLTININYETVSPLSIFG